MHPFKLILRFIVRVIYGLFFFLFGEQAIGLFFRGYLEWAEPCYPIFILTVKDFEGCLVAIYKFPIVHEKDGIH